MGVVIRVPILKPVVVDVPFEARGKIPHRVPLPVRNPVPVFEQKPVPLFKPLFVKNPLIVTRTELETKEFKVFRPVPVPTKILVPLFQPEQVDEEVPFTQPVPEPVDQQVDVFVPQFELMAPGEEGSFEDELLLPRPEGKDAPDEVAVVASMIPEPEFDLYGYQGDQVTGEPPSQNPVDVTV